MKSDMEKSKDKLIDELSMLRQQKAEADALKKRVYALEKGQVPAAKKPAARKPAAKRATPTRKTTARKTSTRKPAAKPAAKKTAPPKKDS